MTIVADTNVIVAALIRRGIVRELVLDHPGAFATPESCIAEVWDNRDDWNRKGVPDGVVREALDFLSEEFVTVVPRAVYRERSRGGVPNPGPG